MMTPPSVAAGLLYPVKPQTTRTSAVWTYTGEEEETQALACGVAVAGTGSPSSTASWPQGFKLKVPRPHVLLSTFCSFQGNRAWGHCGETQ